MVRSDDEEKLGIINTYEVGFYGSTVLSVLIGITNIFKFDSRRDAVGIEPFIVIRPCS